MSKDEMLEAKISVKNKLLDYMAYQEKKEKDEEEIIMFSDVNCIEWLLSVKNG